MNRQILRKDFRSNAKLMLSGEYLVLHGAESLSIPLKYSQSLKVNFLNSSPSVSWKTYVKGQHWFDAVFSLDQFIIGNTNDFPTAQNLREIFLAARILNPSFLETQGKYEVSSELDFEINWGMGSSSSLLVNIAKWAEVDPFVLNSKVSFGSGYDLAASLSDKPVLFKLSENKPVFENVNFNPPFHSNLYFAYRGRKKNTVKAVQDFLSLERKDFKKEVEAVNLITESLIKCREIREFRRLIREHEKIISSVIKVPPVGEKLYNDFMGDIKSLGAWGGDFVLLATDMPRDYVITWLRKKELGTWYTYEDIVLKSPETEL